MDRQDEVAVAEAEVAMVTEEVVLHTNLSGLTSMSLILFISDVDVFVAASNVEQYVLS